VIRGAATEAAQEEDGQGSDHNDKRQDKKQNFKSHG
jgi:hypothetical protein